MENKPVKQQPQIMQMISAGASRTDLIRHFSKLTPAKVLGEAFPSMAKLRKNNGEEKVEKALAVIIADAAKAFKSQLGNDDFIELAIEVLNTYYWLTLEDCFIVMRDLKRSKIYGSFTVNTVLSAFDNYNTNRMNMADDMSYSQHLEVKENRPLNALIGKAADKIKRE